ncbi:MAG: HAD-IC family P-type ATPase [Acholeplasmatales bacterium]|nr:HAD-IC family P-type ATPase [Acholeplasmatales bacterium]
MSPRKKALKEAVEIKLDDDTETLEEEKEEESKEEVAQAKVEEVVEEKKEDIYEGEPIDVPIDESFYKPITVKVKQIVEDGTYKTNEVDLKRKKADLNYGLDTQDVLARNAAHWNNVNDKKGTRTVSGIVLSKIFTIFNLLCFGIAAWLISVGAFTKCFFVIIVTANIIIGIVQDLRAKAMIDKLSILSAPTAHVLRDGEEQEIEVKDIVVDDIMLLSNGKQICSDSVVIEGFIEVNESLLTGESDAIVKKPGDLLYSGSFVVSGACKARVEKVGEENYIQKLTKQARKYEKPKSEIMRSLNIIIRIVGILIFILGPLYFLKCYGRNMGLTGAWFGTSEYKEAVTTTAGAIVGMIPSGLFLLTSIALATSVVKLAHNKTLVQELYCIEMLARVNVLCLDKTGTITDGTMTVKGLIEYKNDTGYSSKQLISAILNAQKDDNLTSQALTQKFGLGKKLPVANIVPFSSARKYSITEFEKVGCILLGAPEFILKKDFYKIEADVNRNAKMGYRVLLIARGEKLNGDEIAGKIEPISLILIEDTIRPDAYDTINYFKENGVNVKVISGDNPVTVSKVSERAGIEGADKYISLDGLSDKEVIKAATKYNVFGRVSPTQKKLLVKTLKTEGNTVAMTGDGVNDILALKEADCSIAMASGSEAARNVSHLVLMDSNFSSLPKVVSEGRRVINNIQRVSTLFLTKTIFSTLLLFLVVILPFMSTYPLDPGQLYMIDFLVVGIPSFFLALEINRNRIQGSFIRNVLRTALPGALVIVAFAILAYWLCDLEYGCGKQILQILRENNGIADYIKKYSSFFSYISTSTLSEDEMIIKAIRTTIVVISTTFTCFLVLFRVCKPFNYLRGILWTLAFSVAFVLVCTIPWFFGILPFWRIGIVAALLLLVFMIGSYPLMIILSDTKRWFKDRIKHLSEWMGHIDEN